MQVGKTYTIKIANGDELVAKVSKINSDSYTLDSPLKVFYTGEGLQLAPALLTNELNGEIDIYKNTIAMTTIPREDIGDVYRQSVTGIEVPDKKIILG